MNPVLKKHLEEAQRKHGITFDVVRDWDKLQELSQLADAALNSETAAERAMVRPCITIGNCTFHRITIGASNWVDRVTEEFGIDNAHWLVVLAFAMAHAKQPREKLWPLFANKDAIQSAIDEWANGLGVDFQTLQTGLLAFIEEGRTFDTKAQESSGQSKKTGYGRLIDVLCSEYGKTPEHWLWDVPLCDIESLMSARSRRIAAESKTAKTDPNDPSVKASHRLFVGVRELAERIKAA